MPASTMIHRPHAFGAILESRIAELQRGIQKLDDIAVEQNPDQADESQSASDRELAISNIDRNSKELRNARSALRRIREGTFGVCEECDEDIHPKRLAAIPWASLCIVCQEALERRREEMKIQPSTL